MKVIVAGGRDFNDFEKMKATLDKILKGKEDITIVSGTARGADTLGERYAMLRGYKIERHPANWTRFGKRAGYIRNEEMADNADYLVAYWDYKSRGTMHMINIAKEKKLGVIVIKY